MYTWGYIKENTLSKLNLTEEEANQQGFLSRFPYYANEAMTQICSSIKPMHTGISFITNEPNEVFTFPENFVSFSDDVATYNGVEASDEDLTYLGYNQVVCHEPGTYYIPYNARWFFFVKELHNAVTITAPADICDAIPSYIASQCYKIDDETKSGVYRNEYEMFLARIDDTSFKSQRTFHVGGGW